MSALNIQSDYINQRALKGLIKLGDIIIPGGDDLPSFSETNSIAYIDEILEVTDPDDVGALNILLNVIYFMPEFFTRGILKITELCANMPDAISNLTRMINIALRGIPLSLYYSGLQGEQAQGKNVFDVLEYDIHCEPDYDFKNW